MLSILVRRVRNHKSHVLGLILVSAIVIWGYLNVVRNHPGHLKHVQLDLDEHANVIPDKRVQRARKMGVVKKHDPVVDIWKRIDFERVNRPENLTVESKGTNGLRVNLKNRVDHNIFDQAENLGADNKQQKVDPDIPSTKHVDSGRYNQPGHLVQNQQQNVNTRVYSGKRLDTSRYNQPESLGVENQQQNVHLGKRVDTSRYNQPDNLEVQNQQQNVNPRVNVAKRVDSLIIKQPSVVNSDKVMSVDDDMMKKMLAYPKRDNYNDRVLILTPIHNVGDILGQYGELLKSLTYPHRLISIGLGEDSSTDDTLSAAKNLQIAMDNQFSRVEALHLNLPETFHVKRNEVHAEKIQLGRRKHLAEARNKLLSSTLKNEDWVLWIDSDVSYLPPDIIQQLLSADKDIVVPLCIVDFSFIGTKHVYDKNTWRETDQSLEMQRQAPKDKLFLEGYGPSYRIWLSNLRPEGRVVPIDGVGGCTLLVKASCHRKGLIFPESIFDHHIETEGLAKMAKHMGFGVYGMPFVEVVHKTGTP